jgi:hypothetical protein
MNKVTKRKTNHIKEKKFVSGDPKHEHRKITNLAQKEKIEKCT